MEGSACPPGLGALASRRRISGKVSFILDLSTRRRDGNAPRGTKFRAAPYPIRFEFCQSRLHRIFFDIRDHFFIAFGIAHVTIHVFPLPKLSFSLQDSVSPMTCERLPRVHYFPNRKTLSCFDKSVDVIRHHAPGEEAIARAIKMQQRVLHKFRKSRPLQPALTV